MPTILLLTASNAFMTIAWYWHLKHPAWSLWQVILISWAIAGVEYCLAVPANRLGYGTFTGAQLKIIQEVITLGVFAVFAVAYLGEEIGWNYLGAVACLIGAVFFIFRG